MYFGIWSTGLFLELFFVPSGRQFSRNIIPYFCYKLGKMLQNLSPTVVIGALSVKDLN